MTGVDVRTGGGEAAAATPATMAEILLARRGDQAPGLLHEDQVWTWDEVVGEAAVRAAAAAELRTAAGPAEGPAHIGVLLDNVPEYLFWLGGAALAQTALVGINPTRRGEELAADIAFTDIAVVITDDAGAEILKECGTDVPVLSVESAEYAALLARHAGAEPPAGPFDPQALYLLLFTSGTSGGASKAVRFSQGKLARSAPHVAKLHGIGRDDVCYCPMPLFHGNALMVVWHPTMVSGARMVLPRKFSASKFLDDVRRHRATFFSYVGKAITYVLAQPETPHDGDNALVRAFGNEASAADIREFRRRFGCELVEGYGSSEGGVVLARTPETPDGALGIPTIGDVAVVDPVTREECPRARFGPDGQFLNAAEAIGELVNREGAPGFEGYYKNDEAMAERLRDGWFWSNDLAYVDEDGWFWYAGRAADWLRVDGENFPAVPVERVLVRHPDVMLAAVFPVPDPRTGDEVMAALELRDGARLDPAALPEFFAAQTDMGTKWLPRYLRVVDVMPFTGSNKVLKKELRAEAWARPGTDTVYWRPDPRSDTFRPMDDADRDTLAAQLRTHGRGHLMGW